MKTPLALLIITPFLFAGGPSKIALIDRSLAPMKIKTSMEFDYLSHLEVIVAADELSAIPSNESDSATAARLGISKVNRASINGWKQRTMALLHSNFAKAGKGDMLSSIAYPAKMTNQNLSEMSDLVEKTDSRWSNELHRFYKTYWAEQERLAALWPSITSEIGIFDGAGETDGSQMEDRTFQFTFDDGPTAANSPTDDIIATLRAKNISATFYLLSNNLNDQAKVHGADWFKKRYAGMKIGSHGQKHSPYPKLPDPVGSLNQSVKDIQNVFGKRPITFRPPYGQRTEALAKAASKSSPVVLWNIDSQDWQSSLSAQQIADRTITLMLMYRHGIVLFHDLYPRSAQAVENISSTVNGIQWK